MLDIEEINTFYGLSHIIQNVSLTVGKSGVVALLGRNGVGKTTILRSIMGIVRPRGGRIKFMGEDITGLPTYKIARRGVTLIPENRRIYPGLTVIENLEMGLLSSNKANRKQKLLKISEVFALFPGLSARRKQMGGTLSGGEQQMLAIARALMCDPQLYLMDEPTEGLAPKITEGIVEVIFAISRMGKAILLVEQNARLALEIAERCYIMEKGQIVNEGRSSEILDSKEAIDKLIL